MKSLLKSVDQYIEQAPKNIQPILRKVRKLIRSCAPHAEEMISYMMPSYKLHKKPLVYFAAMKSHLGFYATPNGNKAFSKELKQYNVGKGSIQFPYDQPIPYDLIKKIIDFRVEEEKKHPSKTSPQPSRSQPARSTAKAPKQKSPKQH